MKMHLVKSATNSLNGLPQLEPAEKKNLPMFMHCTGGSIAVTVPHFFDDLMPVFTAHGIEVSLDADFVMNNELAASKVE